MKKSIRIMLCLVMMTVAFFAMAAVSHAMESPLTPPAVNTLAEYQNNAAGGNYIMYVNNKSYGETIIPINVTRAGILNIAMILDQQQSSSVYAKLYANPECTSTVSTTSGYLSPKVAEATSAYYTVTARTYYLKVDSSYNSSGSTLVNGFRVACKLLPSGDKVIANGQTLVYYADSTRIKDFKFTATVNGKVTVSCASDYGYYVQILSASKGILSEERWLDKGTGCDIAVKKGKTYFIRVHSIDSNTTLAFTLKQTAIKEKSGKSKKKAVTLKANKTVKGTIAPGSKRADWYKITNKKKKKLTITLTTESTNYLTLTVYDKKVKKIGSRDLYHGTKWSGNVTYGTTYGKANKGTYYIKISRKSSKDSGVYSLKWK